MSIELTYFHNSTGWHTEASYRGADGEPMFARFAGRWTLPEVIDYLGWARANDRNRGN